MFKDAKVSQWDAKFSHKGVLVSLQRNAGHLNQERRSTMSMNDIKGVAT